MKGSRDRTGEPPRTQGDNHLVILLCLVKARAGTRWVTQPTLPWQPLHPPAFPPQEAAPGRILWGWALGKQEERRSTVTGLALGAVPRQRRLRLQEHRKTWPQMMGNL